MRIYVAAPWVHKQDAQQAADYLASKGYEITSIWHHSHHAEDNAKDTVMMSLEAIQDVTDVMRAEAMVVLNLKKSEGKAVEQGIAIACNIPVVVVGTEPSNVFQHLPSFSIVPTLDAAIEELETLARNRLSDLAA